jgi:hypothetical protein
MSKRGELLRKPSTTMAVLEGTYEDDWFAGYMLSTTIESIPVDAKSIIVDTERFDLIGGRSEQTGIWARKEKPEAEPEAPGMTTIDGTPMFRMGMQTRLLVVSDGRIFMKHYLASSDVQRPILDKVIGVLNNQFSGDFNALYSEHLPEKRTRSKAQN